MYSIYSSFFFFFNDTATTEIYTLSLHDALPISCPSGGRPAQLRDLDGAAHEAGSEPGHAAQVGQGGGDDVDARVEVVDPVHRDLVDPQTGAFGQHEQFGVEKPAGVPGEREQCPRLVAPDRLEAALRVGKACSHQGPQQ